MTCLILMAREGSLGRDRRTISPLPSNAIPPILTSPPSRTIRTASVLLMPEKTEWHRSPAIEISIRADVSDPTQVKTLAHRGPAIDRLHSKDSRRSLRPTVLIIIVAEVIAIEEGRLPTLATSRKSTRRSAISVTKTQGPNNATQVLNRRVRRHHHLAMAAAIIAKTLTESRWIRLNQENTLMEQPWTRPGSGNGM